MNVMTSRYGKPPTDQHPTGFTGEEMMVEVGKPYFRAFPLFGPLPHHVATLTDIGSRPFGKAEPIQSKIGGGKKNGLWPGGGVFHDFLRHRGKVLGILDLRVLRIGQHDPCVFMN